ncbi:MAG: Cell envelope-related transcriptional attenuator [Candidatus Roizmanbacteria bacterium GW2011_GWA2_35_19]|uniref:Cell envelope-related transcriptional attenuator n=2 Tax=Candidatus Roizmaniibacteriota TaxID=1752723 RepID=A0A0G0BYL9_9BACT|nr:MAG: Cell envelope-related transcriptional attenuator [Candidatus Roizmanbacteria bacterium GW2011_GWC2_35_12]KKP74419.1 MAG: Cell envelope-related transcriptional attenuator [Candidatus Roizmanbacteria bacterium GW2011_GWA2_35_19]
MNKAYKWSFFFIGLIFVVSIVLLRPYYIFMIRTLRISPLKLIFTKGSLNIYDNQVNILFLGIAGKNHDGPNLSDSIVVLNYNFKNNKITTISIPRDIWSSTLKDKINSAFAYGEAKKPGSGGFILARAEISSIIGLPVQYAAVIDFDKFKELIDFVGGIEVEVENSFVDKQFPIAGEENNDCNNDPEFKCRFETVSFSKGKTLMTGETALKFVRSRNAEGKEGTDFAREKRQQKVIEAVKNSILIIIAKPNIKSFDKLYSLLDGLVKREVNNQQVATIVKNIVIKRNPELKKISLDESLFINPPLDNNKYDGLWVLVPENEDFSIIHKYIECSLTSNNPSLDCLKDKGKENK